jgi:hypothetical protein
MLAAARTCQESHSTPLVHKTHGPHAFASRQLYAMLAKAFALIHGWQRSREPLPDALLCCQHAYAFAQRRF